MKKSLPLPLRINVYCRKNRRGLVRHKPSQTGIALGPILFIIAIVALLAMVIAAGSGSFTASTSTESAKAMAEVLIQTCDDYQRAVQMMVEQNGCDISAIDFSPPGYPSGTTWTGGDFSTSGTGHTGNGQCAMFDPRGGNMIFKPVPLAALANPSTGLYTGGYGNPQSDYWIGYPMFGATHCITGVGTCSATKNAQLELNFFPIAPAVCSAVNQQLSNNVNYAGGYINFEDSMLYNVYAGSGIRMGNASTSGGYHQFGYIPSTASEVCAFDQRSWNGGNQQTPGGFNAYGFYCTLWIN